MSKLFTRNKFYTLLLLILPSLIALSWLNNYVGNYTYDFRNYLLTHVLPAVVLAYIVALLTAEYLDKLYQFTYARVLFTLLGMIGSLFLFSYLFHLMGYDAQFLTAKIPADLETQKILGIVSGDPLEAASKFYSAQLVISMVLLVIFYSIASAIFKPKHPRQLTGVDTIDGYPEELLEEPVKKKKAAAKPVKKPVEEKIVYKEKKAETKIVKKSKPAKKKGAKKSKKRKK